MKAGWRVVVPDLRGFGESSRPREEEAYMLRCVQADVVALLDALGVRECAAGLLWNRHLCNSTAVSACHYLRSNPTRTQASSCQRQHCC